MVLSLTNLEERHIKYLVENHNSDFFKSSNFLGLFIRDTERKILNIVQKNEMEEYINLESYLISCDKIVEQQLEAVFEKIFIVEKKIFQNNNKSNNKKFENTLKTKQYQKELLEAYPGAYKVAVSLVDQFVESQYVLLDRFKKDYKKITMFFSITSMKIEALQECGGDLHGGQEALKLELARGCELYYKPNCDGNNYVLLQEMIDLISDKSKEQISNIKIPFFIPGKQYVWQECIDFNPLTSETRINEYYQNQGLLLSVFYVLGSVDMHCENIISHNGFPMPIDLEALFSNVAIQTKEDALPFADTVLPTSMLPFYFLNSNFNYDISGISGINEPDGEISRNLPNRCYLENNPQEVENAVIFGFSHGYEIILHNIKLVKNIISRFQNNICRFIYRPTATYQKLLLALVHPNYQLETSRDEDLIDNALQSAEKYFLNHEIEISEKKDIIMHNYPIFFFKVNSKYLIDSRGKKILGFFKTSSLDIVYEKLNNLSVEDLKKQITLIRFAFQTRFDKKEFNHILHKNNLDGLLMDLNSSFIHNRNGTIEFYKLSDPTELVGNVKKRIVLPLGSDLYDGYSGIALSLALLHEARPDNQLAKKLLDEVMRSVMRVPERNDCSAFFGSCSVLYVKLYVGLLQNNIMAIQSTLNNLEKRILEVAKEPIVSFDYLTGISGLLLFTDNVVKAGLLSCENSKLLAAIARIKDKCLSFATDVLKNDKHYLTGFAHGFSGLAVGLAALYSMTADENLIPIIYGLISKEDSYLETKNGKWVDLRDVTEETFCGDFFCYGLPGITVARQIIFEKTGSDIGLTSCIRTLKKHKMRALKEEEDCLCHGRIGNAFILKYLNINTSAHFKYLSFGFESLGLMNGLAGVLLYDLQEMGIKVSNPMVFELPINKEKIKIE